MLAAMQEKMVDENRQLSTTKAQILAKQRDQRQTQLTLRHLNELDQHTRVYASVGKMYVLIPQCQVLIDLVPV